jgi:hypothetical protein
MDSPTPEANLYGHEGVARTAMEVAAADFCLDLEQANGRGPTQQ